MVIINAHFFIRLLTIFVFLAKNRAWKKDQRCPMERFLHHLATRTSFGTQRRSMNALDAISRMRACMREDDLRQKIMLPTCFVDKRWSWDTEGCPLILHRHSAAFTVLALLLPPCELLEEGRRQGYTLR